MADPAHEATDKLIEEMEKKVAREYAQAAAEVQEKLEDYWRRFEIKDEKWQIMVANGTKTADEYKAWRQSQLMMGERWENLRDELAEDLHNANNIARSIVKGYEPEVYALNHNYVGYEIEHGASVDASWTLYDRQTVERIMREQPDLLPGPGTQLQQRIAAGKDVRWQAGQIQSVTLQGILQGESIPNMARRIASTMAEKNYGNAVRYARTATTNAQNAGRYDGYRRARDMGIDLTIEWMATLDDRTRTSHRELHGQRREVDEPFEVDGIEIMYPAQVGKATPGSSNIPQQMIWNCRCTLAAWVKGFEPGVVRSSPKMGDMTFEEWLEAKPQPRDIEYQTRVGESIRQGYVNEYRAVGNSTIADGDERGIMELGVGQLMTGQHISNEVVDILNEDRKVELVERLLSVDEVRAEDYVEAVEAWSGNAYQNVRRFQQGGEMSLEEKEIALDYSDRIESYIENAPKWESGVTFRGVAADEATIERLQNITGTNEPFDMRGTSSWSSSLDVAQSNTEKHSNALERVERVVYESPTQSQGTSIMALSETPFEYEVLVSKEAGYAVESVVKDEDGIWRVRLRER